MVTGKALKLQSIRVSAKKKRKICRCSFKSKQCFIGLFGFIKTAYDDQVPEKKLNYCQDGEENNSTSFSVPNVKFIYW